MNRFTNRSPRGWVCDWCSKAYDECECDPRQRALEAVADAARVVKAKTYVFEECGCEDCVVLQALADALDKLDEEE